MLIEEHVSATVLCRQLCPDPLRWQNRPTTQARSLGLRHCSRRDVGVVLRLKNFEIDVREDICRPHHLVPESPPTVLFLQSQNERTRRISTPQIMYHPQSGWFDEGPQRGPVTCRKGPK